jgi:AraC family transcriptional regulator
MRTIAAYVETDVFQVTDASRTRLLESSIALVENLRRCNGGHNGRAEQYSPDFQVCLPYRGFFVWHVAGDDVAADSNQVLFVSGGEPFRVSEPVPGGYAELIVTPVPAVLAEIADATEAELPAHPLFQRRSRRADPRLQLLRARFLHRAVCRDWDDLCAEEFVIALLRTALVSDGTTPPVSASTRRLIRRTKEFLGANLSQRLRLADVGAAVGASPAYLTDVFRRVEGVPLHQYLTQLRLARALVELPGANDLTTLAFDLGFASHSHFAATFRRIFGCTPSHFRGSARRVNPLLTA